MQIQQVRCANFNCDNVLTQFELRRFSSNTKHLTRYFFCRSCRGSNRIVLIRCAECQKPFSYNGGKRKCFECRNPPIIKNCDECGKQLLVTKKKFCSDECQNARLEANKIRYEAKRRLKRINGAQNNDSQILDSVNLV